VALEDVLEAFPETARRADAAVRFCHWIKNLPHHKHDDYPPTGIPMREACMRASLAELVSIEDALVRDVGGADSAPIKMHQSANPLLHIVRELRHLNVHLVSSSLVHSSRPASYVIDGDRHDIDYTLWTIRDLTVDVLRTSRNAKYYTDVQQTDLVAWFNQNQEEWGVDHLILHAITMYAQEIVDRYLGGA
jgi:hypothetical protein